MSSTNPANPKTYHVLDNANQVTTDPCQHADYDVINSQNCDLNHSNYNSTLGGGVKNHENHPGVNPQQNGQRDSELNQLQSVQSDTGMNHQNQQSFQHCVRMNPQRSTDLAINQQSCSQDQRVFHEMLPPVCRDPTICASTVNIVTVNHQNDQGRNQQSIRLNSDMNPHSFILPDRQPGLSSYYRHQRPVNKVQPPTCEDCQHPLPPRVQNSFNSSRQVALTQNYQFQNQNSRQDQYDSQFGRPTASLHNHHTYHGNIHLQFQQPQQDAPFQNHHHDHGNFNPQHQQFAHPQQVHNCQCDYQQHPLQNQYQCYPAQGNNMPTAGHHYGQCNAVQPVKHEIDKQVQKSPKEEKSLSSSKIDDSKARKKRITMSHDQLEQLENFFYNVTAFPCCDQIYELLGTTKLTEKELRVCVLNK